DDKDEIINCYDIYKQLSLNYPSLHNHTIQYALIKVRGNFLEAQAKIILWNPFVETPEGLSVSQIWVVAGDHDDLISIEAGWEVHPPRYGDYQTRFFILWTVNGYLQSINLECPGFVQTSSDVSLGYNFIEMYTFNGDPKGATFSIYKDQNSGNWEFWNIQFFNHVKVIDENYKSKDPEDVETYVSNRNCYDLKVDEKRTNGYNFYHGGLAYNNNCP
ncbi:hypothetical protein C5167_048264, partial [Papaver somniferum]